MTELFFESKYVTPGESARIEWGWYADGATSIRIVSLETGEPLVTATVCLAATDITPARGNVIIKDYAENEGTYLALRKAGIISAPVTIHPCGYMEVPECQLLVTVDGAL